MTKPITLPSAYKHISVGYAEALEHIYKRKTGEIRSLVTPWTRFNNAIMGGLDWNTINVIAGRPGSGKTLMSSIISRQAFNLNPHEKIAVLDFQFEMLTRTSAQRELAGALSKSMHELNSVGYALSDADFEAARRYVASIPKDLPIYSVEKPQTVAGIKEAVRIYCEHMPDRKVIITLDHTLLVKGSSEERSVTDKLYGLGEALTELKRQYNCLFIVLTQMNREIEGVERRKPRSAGNFPTPSDVFGSDALLQHADTLIAINRPADFNIFEYGAPGFVIHDKNVMAVHILKSRNSETGMLWFLGEFKKMNLLELQETHPYYPVSTVPIKK